MLVWINASYFCCGIETTGDGIIIDTAPIVRWAMGKPAHKLRSYLERKGVLLHWRQIKSVTNHR